MNMKLVAENLKSTSHEDLNKKQILSMSTIKLTQL
jgi:hypothetical protein